MAALSGFVPDDREPLGFKVKEEPTPVPTPVVDRSLEDAYDPAAGAVRISVTPIESRLPDENDAGMKMLRENLAKETPAQTAAVTPRATAPAAKEPEKGPGPKIPGSDDENVIWPDPKRTLDQNENAERPEPKENVEREIRESSKKGELKVAAARLPGFDKKAPEPEEGYVAPKQNPGGAEAFTKEGRRGVPEGEIPVRRPGREDPLVEQLDPDSKPIDAQASIAGPRKRAPANQVASVSSENLAGNNPGNMKTTSGGWQRFATMDEGIDAIGRWLERAQEVHGRETTREIIERYAPSSDPGNTGKGLPEKAAAALGVRPDEPVDMRDPRQRTLMTNAILEQEGRGHLARPVNYEPQAPAQPAAPPFQLASLDLAGMRETMDRENPPDRRPLPAGTTSPAVIGSANSYAEMRAGIEKDKQILTSQKYGLSPNPGVWEQLGHLASYVPAFLAQAASGTFGFGVDGTNAAMEYLANMKPKTTDPSPSVFASLMGQGGPTNQTSRAGPSGRPQVGMDQIRTLGGVIPKEATNLPSQNADIDRVAQLGETYGFPATAMMTAGIGGAARAAAKIPTIGGKVGKFIRQEAKQGGIAAITFGEGQHLAETATGKRGADPETQLYGAGLGIALEAARLAMYHGGSAALSGGNGWFQKTIRGSLSPEAIMEKNLGGKTAAEKAAANVAGFEAYPTTVPGLQVPPATSSGNAAAQAMMQAARKRDRRAAGLYDEIMAENDRVIENAAAKLVPGEGSGKDVVAHFTDSLGEDRNAMVRNLRNARDDAEATYNAAIRDARVGEDSVEAKIELGRALGQALRQADDDLKAFANWRWEHARKAGVMEVPVPHEGMYAIIQELMQQAIREGHGDSFPWAAVRRLYKEDPRKMFDDAGNLVGSPTKNQVYGFAPPAGGNAQRVAGYKIGDPIPPEANARVNADNSTVDTWHTVQSDLEGTLRQERKAVSSPMVAGDPQAVRFGSMLAERLNAGIDDALAASSVDNKVAYRLATAASANYYNLMHRGEVGRLMGRDLQGGPATPTTRTFEQLVPGDVGGADATAQLLDVIHSQQRLDSLAAGGTGAPLNHPADALANHVRDGLRLYFGQVFKERGAEGAAQWRTKNAEVLKAFPALSREVDAAVASGKRAEMVAGEVKKFDELTAKSDANLFLAEPPEKAIEHITHSKDPAAAMRSHLDETARDSTGRASNGLGRLMVGRLMAEAVDPDGGVNPRALREFWTKNEPAFKELADRGIVNLNDVRQVVNSLEWQAKIAANPGAYTNAAGQVGSLSLSALIRRGFQMGGAAAGRAAGTGTIQVPGMASQMAGNVFDVAFEKMTGKQARDALIESLFDSKAFQQIAHPQGQTIAQKVSGLSGAMDLRLAPGIWDARAHATGPETQTPLDGAGATGLPTPHAPRGLDGMGLPTGPRSTGGVIGTPRIGP